MLDYKLQYIVCKYTQYDKLSQQHTHFFCIHINKDHPNNGLSTESKSYSARGTSSATYPHGATQIHLDARVQHDALGRLYQHHIHTQRALVAGGKML